MIKLLSAVTVFSSVISGPIELFNQSVNCLDGFHEGYPRCVPQYPVRKDFYSNEPVRRGRLNLIGGIDYKRPETQNINEEGLQINEDGLQANEDGPGSQNLNQKRMTLMEFKRALQCVPQEPGLTKITGQLSLLTLVPMTSMIIELMCTWAENACAPWRHCHNWRERFKSKFQNNREANPLEETKYTTAPYQVKLLRVIKGKLYFDWPWGVDRFKNFPDYQLLQIVLDKVTDIRDSVFFMGEDISYLPWNFPFPAFSNSPRSFKFGDMPWPWPGPFIKEYNAYVESGRDALYYVKSVGKKANKEKDWAAKIAKALFVGPITSVRHVFFDIAALRPDMIEAVWVKGAGNRLKPWHPLSTEKIMPTNRSAVPATGKVTPGYLNAVLPLRAKKGRDYRPEKYKYIVVLTDRDGETTSDQLATLLSDTGSVVLLQEHEFEYHFSARLKPWVHYVPIAYSAADILAKLKWLGSHDTLARRIASNARAFGRSYLRLEDTLCYAASALEAVAAVSNTSDALVPFDPVPV